MTREEIRAQICRHPLTDFIQLEKSKGKDFYCCPFCGSGNNTHHTGALHVEISANGTPRVTCYACRQLDHDNTVIALRKIWQCSENDVFQRLNLTSDAEKVFKGGNACMNVKPAEIAPKAPEKHFDFSQLIEQANADALASEAALAHYAARGFSAEDVKRFKLGYHEAGYNDLLKDHPELQTGAKKQKLYKYIIPYLSEGSCAYFTVQIADRKQIDDFNQKYKYMRGLHVLPFVVGDLQNACMPVLICEGQYDAMTLAKWGYDAVIAAGGGGGDSEIIKVANKDFILLFDNDQPGKDHAARLQKALQQAGKRVISIDAEAAFGSYNDPNGVMQAADQDENAVTKACEVITEGMQKLAHLEKAEVEERAERTGSGMIDDFLQTIQTRRYEPIPTGIKQIDDAIGGGFTRQSIAVLSAEPGAGKTAFAQWIFEELAAKGNSCIYLNLEMAREHMIARSLSRIINKSNYQMNITQILQGYAWKDQQRSAVLKAVDSYKENIAPHLIYNPDQIAGANIDSIAAYIEKEAAQAEAEGKNAPFVVVDYLQLLTGEPREDASTIVKRAMITLKNFAKDHNTIVFVISAQSRTANKAGAADMTSGRDSSGIEYTADYMFGLGYTEILKGMIDDAVKESDLERMRSEAEKSVTLKINKCRFGRSGVSVDLKFNGAAMTFTENKSSIASRCIPVKEKSPWG